MNNPKIDFDDLVIEYKNIAIKYELPIIDTEPIVTGGIINSSYKGENEYHWAADFEGLRIVSQANVAIDRIEIKTKIENNTEREVRIKDILPFGNITMATELFDRVYISSISMIGFDGIVKGDNPVKSYSLIGFTDAVGENAILMGFTRPDNALYHFNAQFSKNEWTIGAFCPREGTILNARGCIELSPMVITFSESLSSLLANYGNEVSKNLNARDFQELQTGWCSWYHYYGQENQNDIIENVKMLSKSPICEYIKVIQIDDGWELTDNEHPCCWGDWEPGGKFPDGMRHIVDIIHENGFDAGLWLAPFSAAKSSKLANEHPDWIVKQDETGLLQIGSGDIYGLDLTHPKVQSFLTETFHRVFNEWGFDYIKIDFLLHGAVEGVRYDRTKTSAEAFRIGMDIIRKAAGEKFILNCGSLMLQSVGYCDGMRIGADVGSRWYLPVNLDNWQYGNCAVKPCAVNTLYRQWMNGRLWQNDPDCILVRDKQNKYEGKFFDREFFKNAITCDSYGLSHEEAMFWVRTIWFTRSMGILSEVWDELTEERKHIVERCFPTNTESTTIVDWYENPEVVILKSIEDNLQIGVFNISEQLINLKIPSKKFGINKWSFTECFDNINFCGSGEYVSFPTMQPRTARIWEIK